MDAPTPRNRRRPTAHDDRVGITAALGVGVGGAIYDTPAKGARVGHEHRSAAYVALVNSQQWAP